MFLPNLRLEVAFNAGPGTAAASRVWTDISDYVELDREITVTGGRGDERSACEPNTLNVVLDNADGRFTPERASSPYYPDVKLGRPIRLTAELAGGDEELFFGFVDEWPIEWSDGGTASAYSTVTASSRLARLGAGVDLRSVIEEEFERDAPVAHYTFGEPEGSTKAFDVSGAGQPALTRDGTGTNPVFGTATGPGTDDLTGVTFAAGKYLSAAVTMPTGAATFECFFSTTSSGSIEAILYADKGIGSIVAHLGDGKLFGYGGLIYSGPVINDGLVHHVAWTGDGVTASLYLDGALVSTAAYAFVPTGRFAVGFGYVGSVTHAAVYGTALPAARIADHALSGRTGFAGELPGARIERYATYAGMAAADVDADAGSALIAHVEITGMTVTDALRLIEGTDGGVLFDGRDGRLRYADPDSRYQATSAFTLDADAQELEAGLVPVLDRSALLNDVTAKDTRGALSARVKDQASIEDNGSAKAEVTLASDDDEYLFQAAALRVNRYATPRLRVPSLSPVDVTTLGDALAAAVLAADVGTRFTVTNQPAQSPASSGDYFVEGYSDTITTESWRRSFNVSPAAFADVWLLDSATRSQLDSTTILG